MSRPALEVADIFRGHGPAWRKANAGHVSLGQLKVMSAIESCRTADLGGHVARCEKCAHMQIAYNSCRNRHCPKCQGAAAKQWLAARKAFAGFLAPLRNIEWVVYSKRPFGGPAAVLAYLSRYTHRVAISNRRLISFDHAGVTFKWKDYRAKGHQRAKVMTLATDEFIRRFLSHVLPTGFHRIRHYGLFASHKRAENIARARALLNSPAPQAETINPDAANADEPPALAHPCPCCGGRMIIIETFARGCSPRTRPATRSIWIDTT
jgi:hypothetical protein